MHATLTERDRRTITGQMLVLIGLALAVFWPVIAAIFENGVRNPETSHGIVIFVMIGLLIVLRRRRIAEDLAPGSVWGLVLILAAIVLYFIASWPFNYAVPRRMAIAPAVGGAVLAAGGWRALRRFLPMLLLLLIAIPIGTRYYSFLIIRPETITLAAARGTLDLLPGVIVELDGLDMTFLRGSIAGSIALGVSYRGASLLLASLAIVIFVTFSRVRPWWQVVLMAVAAAPIVLMTNYLRLLVWGLIAIYIGPPPVSVMPRVVASIAALIIAYLLTVATLGIARHLVREGDPGQLGAGSTA